MMNIGIMQPYFFPYLGYFDLINRTDRWVVFDIVKFAPKTWMTRNRILHPTKSWQYISVPVNKPPFGTLICDTWLKDQTKARDQILRQLAHYEQAPYYAEVCNLIVVAFEKAKSEKLVDVNVSALEQVCLRCGIDFKHIICSEAALDLPEITHPGHWALEIVSALGGDIYTNPPGGKALFNSEEYTKRGIELQFTNMPDFKYSCGSFQFIDNLSIIDLLMWNAPSDIKAYLDLAAMS